MPHDIFISYSSQNKEAADAICHVLEEKGIRCWIAPRNIPGGSQYGDVIDNAIKSCRIVIVVFSEPAAASPWVTGELNVAFEEQKTIIPFRIDQTPLSGQTRVMLNQKHWIDAYPDYKTKFDDLIDAVMLALGHPNSQQPLQQYPKSTTKPTQRKWVLYLIAALGFAAIAIWFFTKSGKGLTEYTYNRDDLHVNISRITKEQAVTLTEILDDMVRIEGGSYSMGMSAQDSTYITENDNLSQPAHKVTLHDFYISKFELTQKQWQMLFDASDVSQEIGLDKPVDYLSWQAAKDYADSIAFITGLPFSLPTEAQWEYAARGGQLTQGCIFSGSNDFTEVGWIIDANINIHEVGEKKPNELGLYDMTGNVQELCLDYFSNYTSYSEANPSGPAVGKNVVARGGSILTSPFDAKNSSRGQCEPTFNSRATGTRLVINLN